jgi:hypothetical protein
MLLDVVDTLDFLNDIEARFEAAPDDVEPGQVSAGSLTTAIHALFRDGRMLLAEQQRRLFTDPALRAEFAAIKRQYAQVSPRVAAGRPALLATEMPALAAAATGDGVRERTFPGGSVRITKSSLGDMLIQFSLEREGPHPRALLLEGEGGDLGWTDLPPPDAEGRILLIKDMAKEEHSGFVRLLQDPQSRGTFLR